MSDRTVFFVSDGTGITAETFGNSILAQFPVKARHVRRPFVDTVEKARHVRDEIGSVARAEGRRPIVFITLANDTVRDVIASPQWQAFRQQLRPDLDRLLVAPPAGLPLLTD